MRWKQKAALQNVIARLPEGPSYKLYYLLQKHFGRVRMANPVETLSAGDRFIGYLRAAGRGVAGRRVLEVGTGRQLNLPLVFWMAGAKEIITLDKNPYLKEEMVLRDLAWIRAHTVELREILCNAVSEPGFPARLEELLAFRGGLAELLAMTRIRYIAPADAANLSLERGTIDYHVSFSVFQHVPPDILEGILREGRRVLANDGLLLCYVNMTDHFAHDDSSICLVNYLTFSDREWERLAGNRYMYQNRLRVDDVLRLVSRAGYQLSAVDSKVDERSLGELERGLRVNERFAGKTKKINATTGVWIVARPAGDHSQEVEDLCALLAANREMSFHYTVR